MYNSVHIWAHITCSKFFAYCIGGNTLIFISGRVSAISSAKQGKSGSINNLLKIGRSNGSEFHENPNRILLTLKAHNRKMYVFCRPVQ